MLQSRLTGHEIVANFNGLFGTEFDERALARSSHAHDSYIYIIRTANMMQVSTM
jgi:hypothetical protein